MRRAAASLTLGFPVILRSATPNSMLQVARIGVGGMGGSTMRRVAALAQESLYQ